MSLFGKSLGHQHEHLTLAIGQLRSGCCRPPLTEDRARCSWVERCVAARRRLDRLHELGGLDVLQQIAGGPGVDRLENSLAVRERRQDDDGDFGLLGLDPPRCLDAVDHRHLEVHEHDIRPLAGAERDRALAVLASPTSSTSSNVESSCASPWRTTAWSSAITTRITSSAPRARRRFLCPAWTRRRGAPHPRRELLQQREADVPFGATALALGCREADAVVHDLQRARPLRMRRERPRSTRVHAGDVADRLARRSVEEPLHVLGQWLVGNGERRLDVFGGERRDDVLERCRSPDARRFGGWISTSTERRRLIAPR